MKQLTEFTPPYLLLDDNQAGGAHSYLFDKAVAIIAPQAPDELEQAFREMEAWQSKGYWVAGYFTYELGYALEPALARHLPAHRALPLFAVGLFEPPKHLAPEDVARLLEPSEGTFCVSQLEPELDRATFEARINDIRDYIEAGDIYQANYTYRASFHFEGSAFAFYSALRRAQPVAYGALLHLQKEVILSRSPELFVHCKEGDLTAKPMKGTAARGLWSEQDEDIKRLLQHDEKQCAENLMILDLVRNDLTKISEAGSVRVPARFSVETYPTVHQMVSHVRARVKPDQSLRDKLQAIFPCGSITGAPKLRAMEIIDELETSPRGVYTGAIGFHAPNGDFSFNVAIRTLTLTPQNANTWLGCIGVGGGIVYDSTPAGEYEECQIKLGFLKAACDGADPQGFDLIETLRWDPIAGFYLLEEHLERLAGSARYFEFRFSREEVIKRLEAAVENRSERARVRLLLGAAGDISIETADFPAAQEAFTFALASQPTDSSSPALYHKTTNRAFYDEARAALQKTTDCDEVVFTNEKGFLTEGSFTNLFVERDGMLLTPPLECGLLNGTLRRHLMKEGRVREVFLKESDLKDANIYLGNSLRGLMQATHLTAAGRSKSTSRTSH